MASLVAAAARAWADLLTARGTWLVVAQAYRQRRAGGVLPSRLHLSPKNPILLGPNGVGKSMLAQNLC